MSETTAGGAGAAIESTLQEHRIFEPPAGFASKARINSRAEYDRMYRESIEDPEAFWGKAAEELHWFKKWDRVLDWKPPYAKWFVGGKTNLSYNCLDHHVDLHHFPGRRPTPARSGTRTQTQGTPRALISTSGAVAGRHT